ncbi:unnamed protein product [Protopolystoma xenopodis]|uniref:Uncharacterized protein n=1 Tax=Protopolystoma xenopodis TaxID=117903 RepID=A0A3S5BQ11_9PLAT|nr:unnamed protein product [Protopolystoma xenopodis]
MRSSNRPVSPFTDQPTSENFSLPGGGTVQQPLSLPGSVASETKRDHQSVSSPKFQKPPSPQLTDDRHIQVYKWPSSTDPSQNLHSPPELEEESRPTKSAHFASELTTHTRFARHALSIDALERVLEQSGDDSGCNDLRGNHCHADERLELTTTCAPSSTHLGNRRERKKAEGDSGVGHGTGDQSSDSQSDCGDLILVGGVETTAASVCHENGHLGDDHLLVSLRHHESKSASTTARPSRMVASSSSSLLLLDAAPLRAPELGYEAHRSSRNQITRIVTYQRPLLQPCHVDKSNDLFKPTNGTMDRLVPCACEPKDLAAASAPSTDQAGGGIRRRTSYNIMIIGGKAAAESQSTQSSMAQTESNRNAELRVRVKDLRSANARLNRSIMTITKPMSQDVLGSVLESGTV